LSQHLAKLMREPERCWVTLLLLRMSISHGFGPVIVWMRSWALRVEAGMSIRE
jgi:hypothetical protein